MPGLALWLVVVGAAGVDPPAAPAGRGVEVFRRASPSVFTVSVEGGTGSAVVIGRGLAVTNWHVVERQKDAIVLLRDDRQWGAHVCAESREDDLALLCATELAEPIARIRTTAVAVGERVYALGSPLGLEATFSDGVISAVRKVSTPGSPFRSYLLQTSAPISPGSSGGGLFDDSGSLVGITGLARGEANVQNLNFAIPVAAVLRLMKSPRTIAKSPLPQPSADVDDFGKPLDIKVRPVRLVCAVRRESRFGHFPSGLELISAARAAGVLYVDAFDSEVVTLRTTEGKHKKDFVLADLAPKEGRLLFEEAGSPATPWSIDLRIVDAKAWHLAMIVPSNLLGQPRTTVIDARCDVFNHCAGGSSETRLDALARLSAAKALCNECDPRECVCAAHLSGFLGEIAESKRFLRDASDCGRSSGDRMARSDVRQVAERRCSSGDGAVCLELSAYYLRAGDSVRADVFLNKACAGNSELCRPDGGQSLHDSK